MTDAEKLQNRYVRLGNALAILSTEAADLERAMSEGEFYPMSLQVYGGITNAHLGVLFCLHTLEAETQAPVKVVSDLDALQALKPGDACEFRFPARIEWQPGTVVKNGGSSYWEVQAADSGKVAHGLYIEHVRAPGTDPWH